MIHIIRYFQYCIIVDIALLLNYTVNVLIIRFLLHFNALIKIMGYFIKKKD